MLEKIETALRDLISSLQVARLYPDWHPQFKKTVDKSYASLGDVLAQRQELVIGIVGEEIAFEKEIFFDLSKIIKQQILYLKERGVERIEFLRGLEEEELSKFISFLTSPKEEIKENVQGLLSGLGIKNISVGKIRVSAATDLKDFSIEKAVDYLNVYKDSVDKVSDSLEKMLAGQPVDGAALRSTMHNVMENLLGRHQDFLTFATMKRYDVKTFFHILNVSILAMYFSSKMGFVKEDILDIGTAGLFHDIGKIYISRKIIQKPAKLTEEEYDKIRSHVLAGAEILLKHVENLGVLPVVVCFEHHLKYDLSGYPKLTFYQKPHLASLIVSICDVYDALSQRRDYKSDYPPKAIYELMLREKGAAFEPQLLDKFFKIVGVWPIGTIVALSDKRIAVVREENEDDIFSPKVEVIAPAQKKETIDLRQVKDKNKIEYALNPFKEGKEYLKFIYK